MKFEEIIEKLRNLNDELRRISKGFLHSTPLAKYKVDNIEVIYDLRDLLLMCAVSGSNCLLTGKTGCGKTTIARMVASLFGDYGFLQVDATLDVNKLRDLTFEPIKKGEKLSDAVKTTKLIDAPAVVIDEYNRAPLEITNILQGYLQNGSLIFEGGKEVFPGVDFNGRKYQWKIATVNEGEKYYGTRRIDKASRHRFAVEINLDIFEPSDKDRRELIEHGGARIVESERSHLNDILAVYKSLEKVKISPIVEEFVLYFMRMNQCIKSPEGTKSSVYFTQEYCKGCHLLPIDNEICGNIFAPPERAIINWITLARTFALYRASKYGGEVMVREEDAIASAPFVLYLKMDINPSWVAKRYRGSEWNATKNVINLAYERFRNFYNSIYDILKKRAEGKDINEKDLGKIKKYLTTRDVWVADLKEYEDLIENMA